MEPLAERDARPTYIWRSAVPQLQVNSFPHVHPRSARQRCNNTLLIITANATSTSRTDCCCSFKLDPLGGREHVSGLSSPPTNQNQRIKRERIYTRVSQWIRPYKTGWGFVVEVWLFVNWSLHGWWNTEIPESTPPERDCPGLLRLLLQGMSHHSCSFVFRWRPWCHERITHCPSVEKAQNHTIYRM